MCTFQLPISKWHENSLHLYCRKVPACCYTLLLPKQDGIPSLGPRCKKCSQLKLSLNVVLVEADQ